MKSGKFKEGLFEDRHELGICDCCSKNMDEEFALTTLYGDTICADCWDEYVDSEAGGVEYFVNICREPDTVDAYDADALGSYATSWMRHKTELKLSSEEIDTIEETARALKILD